MLIVPHLCFPAFGKRALVMIVWLLYRVACNTTFDWLTMQARRTLFPDLLFMLLVLTKYQGDSWPQPLFTEPDGFDSLEQSSFKMSVGSIFLTKLIGLSEVHLSSFSQPCCSVQLLLFYLLHLEVVFTFYRRNGQKQLPQPTMTAHFFVATAAR